MQGFPKDFWWGTTQTSVGTEGATSATDWSRFEQSGKAPESGDGNGFGVNYVEDFALLAESGLTNIRLTVEWARLEPYPGSHDPDAIEHYRTMFEAAKDAGISAWATFHNGSLPGWFAEDEHGYSDKRSRSYLWARHVDFVAEILDGTVAGWCPLDDPVGWAHRGFHLATRPPGRSGSDEALIEAVDGALEASLIAWKLLRSGRQPVMGVFGVHDVRPVRPEAKELADRWTDFGLTSWARAISEGELFVPGKSPREREDWVDAFDIIGLNVSPTIAIEADGTLHAWPNEAKVDGSGFAPNAEQEATVIRRVSEMLPEKPLVISSHGIATDDDQWRLDYLRETVEQLGEAIDDGVDLRGYFHNTAIDAYDWANGHENPSGLFTTEREAKPSGQWFIDTLRS